MRSKRPLGGWLQQASEESSGGYRSDDSSKRPAVTGAPTKSRHLNLKLVVAANNPDVSARVTFCPLGVLSSVILTGTLIRARWVFVNPGVLVIAGLALAAPR